MKPLSTFSWNFSTVFRNFQLLQRGYNLSISNIPNNLKPYTVIGVEVSVDEPSTIDFRSDGNIVSNLCNQTNFKALKNATIEIEAEFTVKLKPKFDQTTQTLTVNLVESKIDNVKLDTG